LIFGTVSFFIDFIKEFILSITNLIRVWCHINLFVVRRSLKALLRILWFILLWSPLRIVSEKVNDSSLCGFILRIKDRNLTFCLEFSMKYRKRVICVNWKIYKNPAEKILLFIGLIFEWLKKNPTSNLKEFLNSFLKGLFWD